MLAAAAVIFRKRTALTAGLFALCAVAQADDFLPDDQAFAFSSSLSQQTLRWHWQVADGYSLYRDRIHVRVVQPAAVRVSEIAFPTPIIHQDEFFGPQAVYTHELTLSTKIYCAFTQPTPVTFEVHYQGCADAGLCYPPEVRTVTLSLSAANCAG